MARDVHQLQEAARRYYVTVRTRFGLIVRDPACADDLCQEVFARLCVRLRDDRDIENLWGFLQGIMRNVWLEHLRGKKKGREQGLPSADICDPQQVSPAYQVAHDER